MARFCGARNAVERRAVTIEGINFDGGDGAAHGRPPPQLHESQAIGSVLNRTLDGYKSRLSLAIAFPRYRRALVTGRRLGHRYGPEEMPISSFWNSPTRQRCVAGTRDGLDFAVCDAIRNDLVDRPVRWRWRGCYAPA